MKDQGRKTELIQIRVSPMTKNRLKILADRYCDGNMSTWVEHGILNAPRKKLKKKK